MAFPELQTLIIDDIGPMYRSGTKAPVSKLRPHCIAKPRSCSVNYLCWGFFFHPTKPLPQQINQSSGGNRGCYCA